MSYIIVESVNVMRKCLDCGAVLEDIDMKCAECGSKNLSAIESDKPKNPMKKSTLIKLICAVVAGIIIIGIIISGAMIVIRNTQTAPVVAGVKAMVSGDLDGYVGEFYEGYQDDVRSYVWSSDSADDFKDSRIKEMIETYGDDYEIYVKCVDVRDCSKNTVALLNSDYSKYEAEIQDAKYVTVSIFITGSNSELVTSTTLYSIKIDGKWTMFEDFITADDESQEEQ